MQSEIGYAIFVAQVGGKHHSVKPLSGDPAFKGAGVLEVVEDNDGNTYRAVYTVRFTGVVYVLHAFQKKSKNGTSTPGQDIARVKQRLKIARGHYTEHHQVREAG